MPILREGGRVGEPNHGGRPERRTFSAVYEARILRGSRGLRPFLAAYLGREVVARRIESRRIQPRLSLMGSK